MQYSTFEIRLDNSHKGLFAFTIIPEFKQEFKRALGPELNIIGKSHISVDKLIKFVSEML